MTAAAHRLNVEECGQGGLGMVILTGKVRRDGFALCLRDLRDSSAVSIYLV